MPDMRIIVAAVTGPDVQFESYLFDGRSVGGLVALPIGGNLNQQHTDIINAAKAAQEATHGVTFTQNDKIELWCGRVV